MNKATEADWLAARNIEANEDMAPLPAATMAEIIADAHAGEREAVRKLLVQCDVACGALTAPTHDQNDYNCQDWPPGAGCSGCEGDQRRIEAYANLADCAARVAVLFGLGAPNA